jgi:HAE1 family hydrophobic/amphiphilic exporter-1
MKNWSADIDGIGVQIGGGASVYTQIFSDVGAYSAQVSIILKPKSKRKHSVEQIDQGIRNKAREIPGLAIRSGEHTVSSIIGGGPAIEVDIVGHDLATADSLTQLVMSAMSKVPGVVDITSNRQQGNPEIELAVDRAKAAFYGLTPFQIGSALRTQVQGDVATKYRIGGKEYDMLIRLQEDQRNAVSKIMGLTISSPRGQVLLKDVVNAKIGTSPLTVEHKDNERVIKITANAVGQSAGRVAGRIGKALAPITVPPGFQIKLSGSYEDMAKSFRDLAFIILIAVMLVFMVMASQFESYRDPFVIMFTVPLGIIGVIWMLFLTGTTLSVISGIGVLVLVGVVVSNGIVYIDYVNQLRRFHGLSLHEAVKEGGRIRMRPIIMTALTTIFGLVPLALKLGEGAELWSPLGRAVIGGLVVSTFLTLIFIPVLYTSFEEGVERRKLRRQAKD